MSPDRNILKAASHSSLFPSLSYLCKNMIWNIFVDDFEVYRWGVPLAIRRETITCDLLAKKLFALHSNSTFPELTLLIVFDHHQFLGFRTFRHQLFILTTTSITDTRTQCILYKLRILFLHKNSYTFHKYTLKT